MNVHFFELDLVLWFLWVFVKVNKGEGQFNRTADLQVKFHKQPFVAYAHHPIQGVCSGTPGPNGLLTLEIEGKKPGAEKKALGIYAIGDQVEVEKRMEMLSMNTKSRYYGSGEFKRTVEFKICPTDDLVGGKIICSTIDGEHSKKRLTFQAINYRASKPTEPVLRVFYHLQPNIVIAGEILKVHCSAIVGVNGRLFISGFSRAGQHRTWTISWNDSHTHEKVHNADMYMSRVLSRRGPKIKSDLFLNDISPSQIRAFVCFSTDVPGGNGHDESKGAPTFQRGQILQIKDYPYKPKLVIDDSQRIPEAWVLKGTCRSFARDSQSLSLVFRAGVITNTFKISLKTGIESYYFQDHTTDNRHTLISYNAWNETEGVLNAHFVAHMVRDSEFASISCKVKDLQVCKRVRPPKSLQTISRKIKPETSLQIMGLKIAVGLIAGLLVVLLLVLLLLVLIIKMRRPELLGRLRR